MATSRYTLMPMNFHHVLGRYPATPSAQRFAAGAGVVLFYVLLLLQPVLGIAGGMLHGDSAELFGRIILPPLLPSDETSAHQAFQAHGAVALNLLALVGLHAAAALYHHFILKDDVLVGMLPGAACLPRPDTSAIGHPRLGRGGS